MSITDFIFYILLLWVFFKLFLQKGYNKGLDEFNKEQEKAKVKEPEEHELTTDEYDVIAGLHGLGYDKRLAKRVVLSININNNLHPEELLRESLKHLQKAKSNGFNKGYKAAFEDLDYNPVADTKKVNYKPQTVKINPLDIPEPLRRLTEWKPLITEVKETFRKAIIKPDVKVKESTLKAKVKRPCRFELLTKEDISDLKNLLSENIFKQLTYIQLAWLKTKAIKQGIDDWISLIDSKLSYEENIKNIRQQYGINLTDKEMMVQYERAEVMRTDFYQGIGDEYVSIQNGYSINAI